MQTIQKIFSLLDYAKVGNRLRRLRTVQRVLTPCGSDLEPQRWIFIIGCYGSGTTVLNMILASHPQIAGLPMEGVALTDVLFRPEEFGWTRMWCRCLNDIRLEPGPGGAEIAERIKRQWSLWYPKGAANLLEKSVSNATRMPFLQAYFKPAYFIYIVRSGYAVAEGIRRRAKLSRWKNSEYSKSYPIELCAEQWRKTDELVEQDGSQIEHFLQIYYEELTADPVKVLDKIMSFLGLSPMSDTVLAETWNVNRVYSPICNMNWKSFEQLNAFDIEKIERVAGACLNKHKYKRPIVKAR